MSDGLIVIAVQQVRFAQLQMQLRIFRLGGQIFFERGNHFFELVSFRWRHCVLHRSRVFYFFFLLGDLLGFSSTLVGNVSRGGVDHLTDFVFVVSPTFGRLGERGVWNQ